MLAEKVNFTLVSFCVSFLCGIEGCCAPAVQWYDEREKTHSCVSVI